MGHVLHEGCPALVLTPETQTLLALYRLVWQGSQPTVTERMYLPCRLVDAFVAIDEEMAQIYHEVRAIKRDTPLDLRDDPEDR